METFENLDLTGHLWQRNHTGRKVCHARSTFNLLMIRLEQSFPYITICSETMHSRSKLEKYYPNITMANLMAFYGYVHPQEPKTSLPTKVANSSFSANVANEHRINHRKFTEPKVSVLTTHTSTE